MNNEYLKNRFYEQSIVSFNNINHFFDPDRVYLGTIQSGALDENLVQSLKPSTSLYFMLYKSGFEVFKNYPYFGVGNKNYRIESCLSKKEYAGIVNNVEKYICLTHPHQIYFEFLSEHGIIGTIILLSLIFILLFRILKNLYITKSYIGLGCFCYLITTFIPIIPSGAFFSEFSISLFFINLSIMYASNSKTNIFSSDK
jgi:O-antigen ligase